MELFELFCIIYCAALCTAQDHAENELPKPTLKLQTQWQEVFPSERVVLSCELPSAANWTFTWYRDGGPVSPERPSDSQTPDSIFTISQATATHAGRYDCVARHEASNNDTEHSNAIAITINEIPVPVVAQPRQTVFTSEKVQLSCGMQVSPDHWTYTWYRGQEEVKQGPEVSVGSDGSSLVIGSAKPQHAGQYTCTGQHKQRPPVKSTPSNAVSIVVDEIPVPLVANRTQWPTVFTSETVELSCSMQVSPDHWTYTWYRGQEEVKQGPEVSVGSDGSSLVIGSAKPEHAGQYTCTGQHKQRPVKSKPSNTFSIEVQEIPVPVVALRTPRETVFTSETVELSCGMQVSPDHWTYTWYRGQEEVKQGPEVSVGSDGSSLMISSAKPEHAGQYTCTGQHKQRPPVKSTPSNAVSIDVNEIPVPLVANRTQWPTVFTSETVELSCSMQVSPDHWTYTWYRGQEEVKQGPEVSVGSDGSSLVIGSAKPEHAGQYTCTGQQKQRPVKSKPSNTFSIEVQEIPVPLVANRTQWPTVFTSETVELSCSMQVSPDHWTYTWYRGQEEVKQGPEVSVGSDGSSLVIGSAKPEHAGQYTCTGQHKQRPPVKSEPSNAVSIVVDEIPVPLVANRTQWPTVFTSETVELSCGMQVSPDHWTYTWYRGQEEVKQGPEVSVGSDGSSLVIDSAKPEHAGQYTCTGQHKQRPPVKSTPSNPVSIVVDDLPEPTIKLNTSWPDVFPTENVVLTCSVEGSSEWIFIWYHGGKEIQFNQVVLPADGTSLSISSASRKHAGNYMCRGRHKPRSLSSKNSAQIILKVYDEIPTPGLKQEPEHRTMYPEESLTFSCEVNSSSGWEYLWYKGEAELQNKDARYTIPSTAPHHTGAYRCRATRGQTRPFSTNFSDTLSVDVKARPWATVTLLTGWSEVFSADRLDLKCDVHGSEVQWNYTWTRGAEELSNKEHRIFTPGEDLDEGNYVCQGVRLSRPLYSTRSDPFKTTNLLLKRRVLLSISGCLFFGIIAVFIGCIVMRFTRKSVVVDEKVEEPNLFLTMAELKASDVAHCPLAEYINDEELADLLKDGEDKDAVFNESTPLSIETSETRDAPNNGGLSSFKY